MEKLSKYSFFKELSLRKMLFLALVFGFLINNSEGGCCKSCGGGKSKGKSNGRYKGRKPNKKITLKFTFEKNNEKKVSINEINGSTEIGQPAQENGRNGGDIWLFRVDNEDLGEELFDHNVEIVVENKEDELSGKYLISFVQMAKNYKCGGGYYILYSSNCESELNDEYAYGLFDYSDFKDDKAFQRNITEMKLVACGSIVTDMGCMFFKCTNLNKIIFGNKFNTSAVTDMCGMFSNCSSLKEIKFGNNFDTSKVTNMDNMFYGCSSLEELDLSKFDTSKVKYMSGMFRECSSLKTITGGNKFKITAGCNVNSINEDADKSVIDFIEKKKEK